MLLRISKTLCLMHTTLIVVVVVMIKTGDATRSLETPGDIGLISIYNLDVIQTVKPLCASRVPVPREEGMEH